MREAVQSYVMKGICIQRRTLLRPEWTTTGGADAQQFLIHDSVLVKVLYLPMYYISKGLLSEGAIVRTPKMYTDNSDVDYEPMESDNETIDSYESDDVDLSEHKDDGVMLSDSWKRISDIFSDCRPNSLPELVRNFSVVNPALNCNANCYVNKKCVR
ncbi:hypothetical protein GQR58_008320 [Nymphon striatum]|nr:hypothetical protein GQR58_008320 [Nymphon striatum]